MTSASPKGISILLVDDHPIVRQGYRRVLESQRDFQVVAEAEDAASAYNAFKALSPDVVVMDISMPGASGLEAIRNIRARGGRARILVFSMHSEASLVKAAFNAGAGGYVTKSSEPAVLIRAIRSVAHGERAMSDDIAQVLALESLAPSGSALDQLAEREIEILRQIAAGATNEEVAQNLNLSLKTVQNYHYMIKVKTGLKTDAQLVRLATRVRPDGVVSGPLRASISACAGPRYPSAAAQAKYRSEPEAADRSTRQHGRDDGSGSLRRKSPARSPWCRRSGTCPA